MKKKHFVIAILFIVFLVIAWIVTRPKPIETPTSSSTLKNDTTEEYDLFDTPEHMKNPESHSLSLEIVGPEGETIFPAQARMYNAHIKGNSKYMTAMINCHWKFFLNENNDEVLFRELTNSSVLNQAENDVCGFTNTFIDKVGKLRVELTVELTTVAGDELETISAERSYIVTR